MRTNITTAIMATLTLGVTLFTGCIGQQGEDDTAVVDPYSKIDITTCPAYLGDEGIEGGDFKMAFDVNGSPYDVNDQTFFDGYGVASTEETSWMATSSPIEEIRSFGSGDTATDGMIVTIKGNSSAQSLVMGSFRDGSNSACVDTNMNGEVDEGEGNWKDAACWYMAENYMANCEWTVPDVSNELGFQGAQFSFIVVWNVGLAPGDVSI